MDFFLLLFHNKRYGLACEVKQDYVQLRFWCGFFTFLEVLYRQTH